MRLAPLDSVVGHRGQGDILQLRGLVADGSV
jgi:hypothetical protein